MTAKTTWLGSSARFAVVGASNAAIGYSVFWLGIHAPWHIPFKAGLSQLVAYVIGVGWSFYWNRRWTFRSTASRASRQMVRFIILQAGLALASSLLIGLAVDHLGFAATPSWVAVMAAITLANFVLSRVWAFQ